MSPRRWWILRRLRREGVKHPHIALFLMEREARAQRKEKAVSWFRIVDGVLSFVLGILGVVAVLAMVLAVISGEFLAAGALLVLAVLLLALAAL